METQHKLFRESVPGGVSKKWYRFIYFTDLNKKESGYFALGFILMAMIFREGLIAGVFSLLGFIYGIRWVYLVIKTWHSKKKSDSTNTSGGFIQIPILILITAGVIVIGGVSYFGITKYQNYQTEKAEKEKIAGEKEIAAQVTTKKQQEALQLAQQEIQKLKLGAEAIEKQERAFTQQIKTQQKVTTIDTSNPLDKIPLRSVVKLGCAESPDDFYHFDKLIFGSGVFLDSNNGSILTNRHVINGNYNTVCIVMLRDQKNPEKQTIFIATVLGIVDNLDVAFLNVDSIFNPDGGQGGEKIPAGYVFPKKTPACKDSDLTLGSKLVVIGYPAVGGNTVTVTEGIISGFEGDYIKTSAKIEHGNSGGGAFLVPGGCWIGIPSASVVGEIESLGRILKTP